jgi:hypothetical protein
MGVDQMSIAVAHQWHASEKAKRSTHRGYTPATQWVSVTPTADVSPEMGDALRRVFHLSSLKPGWDSYGTPQIGERAIQEAVRILREAEELRTLPTTISPTASAGIQLGWILPDRTIEMEITPDGVGDILLTLEGQDRESGPVPIDRITQEVLFRLLFLNPGE